MASNPLTPSEQRAYDTRMAHNYRLSVGVEPMERVRKAVGAFLRQTGEMSCLENEAYRVDTQRAAEQLQALKTNPIPQAPTAALTYSTNIKRASETEPIPSGTRLTRGSRKGSRKVERGAERSYQGHVIDILRNKHGEAVTPIPWADHITTAYMQAVAEERVQAFVQAEAERVQRTRAESEAQMRAKTKRAQYETQLGAFTENLEACMITAYIVNDIIDQEREEEKQTLREFEESGLNTPLAAYMKETRLNGRRDRKTHHYVKPKVSGTDTPVGEPLGHDLVAYAAISRARREAHRKALAKVKNVSLDEQEIVEGVETVFSNPKPYDPQVNEPLRLHVALRLAYSARPGELNLAHERESAKLETQLAQERALRIATEPVMDSPLFAEDLALHNHLVLKDLFGRSRDELATIVDEDHDGREVPPSDLQQREIRQLQSELAEIRTGKNKRALTKAERQEIAEEGKTLINILREPPQSAYGSQSATEGDSVRASEVHTSHGAR